MKTTLVAGRGMDKSWGGESKELEVGKSRKQLQHSQGELLVA